MAKQQEYVRRPRFCFQRFFERKTYALSFEMFQFFCTIYTILKIFDPRGFRKKMLSFFWELLPLVFENIAAKSKSWQSDGSTSWCLNARALLYSHQKLHKSGSTVQNVLFRNFFQVYFSTWLNERPIMLGMLLRLFFSYFWVPKGRKNWQGSCKLVHLLNHHRRWSWLRSFFSFSLSSITEWLSSKAAYLSVIIERQAIQFCSKRVFVFQVQSDTHIIHFF